MEKFYKKETLIRTICFMSFFVAINVICSFLTTFLPLVGMVLIIFLPLTSAVVEISCKDRWFPIYALATIGLSIVVSLSSIDFTLFYVVPSILTGYIFGLFSKKNLPAMYAIFFATIIQTALSFAFIPLINLLTDSNLLDSFAKILKISDRFWFNTLLILVFFLVSLMQVVLSYIVVSNELKKFTSKPSSIVSKKYDAEVSSLAASALALIFAFFYLPMSLMFVGISFYFGVFVIIKEVAVKNKFCLIGSSVLCLVSLIIYALLNNLFNKGYELVLFVIPPVLISTLSILYSFLKKLTQ